MSTGPVLPSNCPKGPRLSTMRAASSLDWATRSSASAQAAVTAAEEGVAQRRQEPGRARGHDADSAVVQKRLLAHARLNTSREACSRNIDPTQASTKVSQHIEADEPP
eukprot:CAMPEP_0176316008 /NCGR_PEP_ID=MMETSP0121_2-20121125/68505_1 /TAXON_ID=160619 /ORGANISM="Kryptoperidinium foliaceum, Strain CCMP 1326" /LENGTH=107 /DNA_ID=CAMNT_0017658193 /DNA_START=168 /DNA_END=487 /DNA_ORIENTATION=-